MDQKGKKFKFADKKAFTLIELLIVIAIIGVLAAVVVMALAQSAKEKARIAQGQQFSDSVRAQMEVEIYGNNASGSGWDFGTINGNSSPYTVNASIGGAMGTLGDGTCASPGNGSCPSLADGIKGKALLFDGNDYVNIGDVESLDFGTGPFTVEFWFNRTGGIGSWATLVMKDRDPPGWRIMLNNSDQIFFIIRWESNTPVTSIVFDDTNKWHHIAVTRDNTGLKKIYVDGKEDANGLGESANVNSNQADPFQIGKGFTGLMDEVHAFGEALTAQSIQRIYAESAPRHGIALK